MTAFLSAMCFISAVAFMVYLIILIIKFITKKPKKFTLIGLAATFVCFLVFGIACGMTYTPKEKLSNMEVADIATPKSKEGNAEAPIIETTKEPKPITPVAPTHTPIPTSKIEIIWNKSDLNITTNGNLALAVNLLKNNPGNKSEVEKGDAALIMKAPWDYYGKMISLSGAVSSAEDYPPGSDFSKLLESDKTAEIVLIADDGYTIIDMFLRTSSGTLKTGDYVTVFGYPVGRMEIENRIGGSFTHLILVGNTAE